MAVQSFELLIRQTWSAGRWQFILVAPQGDADGNAKIGMALALDKQFNIVKLLGATTLIRLVSARKPAPIFDF